MRRYIWLISSIKMTSVAFIGQFQILQSNSISEAISVLLLRELPVNQREDAVSSFVYEANARVRDPVYGCAGTISYLQNQVSQLQLQLEAAQAEVLKRQMHQKPHLAEQESEMSFLMAGDDFNSISHYIAVASNLSATVMEDPLTR